MTAFLDYLQFQARSRPQAPAITTLRATLSYEDLVGRARSVAHYLASNKLERGDILVLNLNDPAQHCCAIVGAMAAGITTMSAAGQRPALPNKLRINAVLTDQPPPPSARNRAIRVPPTWLKDLPYESDFPAQARSSEDIARIVCTSGTTGEQKAVPFTEEQLIQRVWAQVAGLRSLAGPSKTLGMMGLSSGAGFTNMMLVLMTGGTLMMAPGMGQLARVSSLYEMDRVLASTAQLIAMLRQQDNESVDFAGVKSMVVGGSHIPRSVAKRARAICRNITCLYGSTEVGVVATAPVETTIKHQSAVGFVAPGVRVEIVEENGNAALGFDREGVIRVSVPGAPTYYLNEPEASRKVFRDGWFYPGDIGSLSSEGLLYVSGRVSERINAGGVKVAPNVIEDVLGQRPEIAEVAAFEFVGEDGISEIAVAIVPHENVDRTNFNRGELRQSIQKQLRERTPKRWIIVKEIPRNEQGKIDRAALQRLSRNRLAAVA
jgi:acyl-CoA synthetase (AMP-forming)/AMP-acid ligase II